MLQSTSLTRIRNKKSPQADGKNRAFKGLFYKNPSVRQTLDKVQEQQGGMSHPRKNILDMAMNNEILSLQKQVRAMQQEMDALRQENEKLKKALDRKNRE